MGIPETELLVNEEENLQNPTGAEPLPSSPPVKHWSRNAWWIAAVVITYLIGLGSGYGLWGRQKPDTENTPDEASSMEMLVEQINPKDGYTLPVSLGGLGAQLVKAGVIDRELFIQIYDQAGKTLSDEQLGMLDGTYSGAVVMNQANAYFLLNFLWALGLSSQNPILESGPIQQNGENGPEGFASTGGWTLATRPFDEIYSSLNIMELTAEQQKRVEDAAASVYRPCCDNPTHFPDCNHGMAMLGLLELMAFQNISLEKMLEAAKYTNAFWYPQQTLEQAVYFQKAEGLTFQDVDAPTILGAQYSSGSGFRNLHQFLGEQGWLPQAPNSGGSCGV